MNNKTVIGENTNMNIVNQMKLTIEAKSQNQGFARSVVGAFCTQLNPTLEQIDDIKTAVSEAVTNCIVHGYQSKQMGDIDIECKVSDDGVLVTTITDYGKGIEDVEQAMKPFFTTGKEGERSGMGFTVMRAFCNNVEVNSHKGKTTVTLVKDFKSKEE